MIEGIKKPRGSREGVARSSAETPEGKRQNHSRAGKVPLTTRCCIQSLTPLLRQRTVFKSQWAVYFSKTVIDRRWKQRYTINNKKGDLLPIQLKSHIIKIIFGAIQYVETDEI